MQGKAIIINALLQGWNFMRILRLLTGMGIAIQGIVAGEIVITILGLFFAGMAVANIGCCSTNGCSVSSPHSIKNKTNDISYEEVDIVK